MLSKDEVVALKTHLMMLKGKIPEHFNYTEMPVTMAEYMGLLINAQLATINEILEVIDKDKEESKKHRLMEEFDRLKKTHPQR